MERFEGLRFSVLAVPLRLEVLCVQFNREDGSGSGFGSWKTVLAVPVPRSVPGKTVPTVPVSSSGSVPGPFCKYNGAYGKCCPCTLVAQCSATPATVAATPPCSATPFQTQISVRHLPARGGGGATPKFLGGVARHRCYTCKTH